MKAVRKIRSKQGSKPCRRGKKRQIHTVLDRFPQRVFCGRRQLHPHAVPCGFAPGQTEKLQDVSVAFSFPHPLSTTSESGKHIAL
jgi:hypothetical protein